jgi:alkylation response protein AidB-like acyl-CoA dehydrogenase
MPATTPHAVPDCFGDDAQSGPEWATDLVMAARTAGEDIAAALDIARRVGPDLPAPGTGRTSLRWRVLTELGRVSLTVARVVEAHCDALAILAEADTDHADTGGLTFGVFAAEAPGHRLAAKTLGDGSIELSGEKAWCSLGDVLDAALVTADTDSGRRMFRVDLRHPDVVAAPSAGWVARGLRTVTSVGLRFDHVPARPVREVDWYLRRPGFAWGGMGVAACWFGGALGLADTLRRSALERESPLDALHVGTVDAAVHSAGATLADAARAVDAGRAAGPAGALLAQRVRAVVAAEAERVIRQVGHALGPGPLAFDPEHAARVADLELYLRQHHAERDLAALGTSVLEQVELTRSGNE